MALTLPVFLTPLVICLLSFVMAVLAALKKTRTAIPHAMTCILLGAAIFLPGRFSAPAHDNGAIQKLRAHDEKAYLELAAYIRDRVPPEFDSFRLNLEASPTSEDYKTRQKNKTELLAALMPDELPVARMWPKEMLNITVDPGMVQIYRGSGMRGQIGVVILKEGGEVETFSEEQLAENSYLPRYTRIYDRVYYFYSD